MKLVKSRTGTGRIIGAFVVASAILLVAVAIIGLESRQRRARPATQSNVLKWLRGYDYEAFIHGTPSGSRGFWTTILRAIKVRPRSNECEEFVRWATKGTFLIGLTPILRNMYTNCPPDVHRAQIVFLLGRYGGTDEVPLLLEALRSPDRQVRLEATVALQQIRNESAVSALCKAAESDEFHNVRANACLALSAVGGHKAEACLRICLKDPHPDVRDAASRSLGRLAAGQSNQ
jgi:hypothetical protein